MADAAQRTWATPSPGNLKKDCHAETAELICDERLGSKKGRDPQEGMGSWTLGQLAAESQGPGIAHECYATVARICGHTIAGFARDALAICTDSWYEWNSRCWQQL